MRYACLFCFVVVSSASLIAAEPTAMDLLPATGWRYFHNPELVDDSVLDQALADSGFYSQWTRADFGEPTVAGINWQPGSTPIGYNSSSFSVGGLPLGPLNAPPLFLRNTFTIPDDVTSPVGLVVRAEDAATIFVDGEEVARLNCCLTAGQAPIGDRPPGYLDIANGSASLREHVVIDNLSPGEHIIAVIVHHELRRFFSSRRLSFDARLYAPGKDRLWISDDSPNWFDPTNWDFGVPGADSVVVFSSDFTADPVLRNPVHVGGIQFARRKSIVGSGSITLGDSTNTGLLSMLPSTGNWNNASSIEVNVELKNDTVIQVGENSRFSLKAGFEANGHTIRKTGEGTVTFPNTQSGVPSQLRLVDGTLGAGRFHGDIVSEGGRIALGFGKLGVSGSVRSPVSLSFSTSSSGVLDGEERGTLEISKLIIDGLRNAPSLTNPTVEHQIITGWDSVSIESVQLPNAGLAQWDVSRLQEGSLSLTRPSDVFAKCDFDASGQCTVGELDEVLSAVASRTNDPKYDLNDDDLVNSLDQDEWLILAGAAIGRTSYLMGDADLDGKVNAADLMAVGLNWQRHASSWSHGDFNGDGIVDSKDLNLVGQNWQGQIQLLPPTIIATSPVPEPASYLLWFSAVIVLHHVARRSRAVRVVVVFLIGLSLSQCFDDAARSSSLVVFRASHAAHMQS